MADTSPSKDFLKRFTGSKGKDKHGKMDDKKDKKSKSKGLFKNLIKD